MKYYVMWISNGSLQSDKIEEHSTISAAKVGFANMWAALENAQDVTSACIVILDSNFDLVEGCKQTVTHPAQ